MDTGHISYENKVSSQLSQHTNGTQKKANQLPQTGNGEHKKASVFGFVSAALASFLSLAGFKKKKTDK